MKKPVRDKIKVPLYWQKLWEGLNVASIGRLFTVLLNYAFYGEADESSLSEEEQSVWSVMKRDLDYQFTHHHAYRYPDNEPMRIRNCEEYRNWRISVFERDHYTCQVCGSVGKKINAHHIKPFAEYPDLRFDVNNGVTLCYQCHLLAHKRRNRKCQ